MASPVPPRLADCEPAALLQAMRGAGLWLDVGAATVRVQGNSAPLAGQLQAVYGAYPLVADGGWADVHVHMELPFSLRRWMRPQIWLRCDGRFPFEPFPAQGPLPFFEWGCNWMIGRRINDLLLLHAGAVERDGLALVMPAMPGSGKSTLTAALSLRGWRLLSDEFGVFDPQAGEFRAMLKPVGLKNRSIDVIRDFSPAARLGPSFPKTHKGMVAHLAPDAYAVDRRHVGARPGAVLLPKWQAGSATRLEPLPPHMVFSALAFNAFNYSVLGAVGYQAVVELSRRCMAWNLVYSDLDDALATLDRVWPSVVEQREAGSA